MGNILTISTTQASSLASLKQKFASCILMVMARQGVSAPELARRLGITLDVAEKILASTCEELSLGTLARMGEVLHVEWEISTSTKTTRSVTSDDITPEDAA